MPLPMLGADEHADRYPFGPSPASACPTLVINGTGDLVSPIEGADLAKRIPGADLVEYPSASHMPADREQESFILDAVEEFVTGSLPAPDPDRVLSHRRLHRHGRIDGKGNRGRRRQVEGVPGEFQRIVRRELLHFRGREIDTAGDGFFATFDGPARAVRFAVAIAERVRSLGIQIRAGCPYRRSRTCWGRRSRTCRGDRSEDRRAGGTERKVLCSSTVKDVTTGSGLGFEDRGEHVLKGVSEAWHLYSVTHVLDEGSMAH